MKTKKTSFELRSVSALHVLILFLLILFLFSCKKSDNPGSNNEQASSYSSEVLDKWITVQLRLMRNATGIPNHAFARYYSYSGVAAFESLAPGIPGNSVWRSKWNGLTGLPPAGHSKDYYYPANINGAMAAINRAFFPNASAADKAVIDSLEAALTQEFLATQSQPRVNVSAQFGKDVATAVFNWAETDGYKNANSAYSIPGGAGMWKPTAPAYAAPATPYWGNNRTVITGSITATQPAPPVAYSTDPSSAFYGMAKQVYDASQVLTDEQKAMAIFWRDVPGATTPGHWLSIVQQVIRIKRASLDEGALAYAVTGAAVNDALIAIFKAKYQYTLVRPITYIREVMGVDTWNAYIGTPAHPEYVSAHSSLSAAAAGVLQELFGNINSFTDHTYDYMGLAPRTYTSFAAIANEAGISRLYGGIHYVPSIQAGLEQGRKVSDNIFSKK